MTVVVEMIVDLRMSRSKILQGLYVPEPGHRPLSSAEWLV
jgi:hypothetical protein